MSNYYAQINENNIVIGISELSGVINDRKLIKIETFDTSLLNTKYNLDIGKFEKDTVPTKTLEQIKQDKISELNLKCFDTICGGFKSYALGIEHTYPSDTEAQGNLTMTIKRMELDPTITSIGFKTLDAGYLPHTIEQLHKVFANGFDYGQQQIVKYNQLKTQVLNSTTTQEVSKINW